MRATLLIAAFLSIAALVVPSATAQPMYAVLRAEVKLDNADGLVAPEQEIVNGILQARIDVPMGTVCLNPIDVLFSIASSPAYADVAILEPKQSVLLSPSPFPQTYEVHTPFTVSVMREAPAFADGFYEFRAETHGPGLQEGCVLSSASEARASILIKNDYVPDIRLGEAQIRHEGLMGVIAVPVENHGNGPTRVRPVLASSPSFVQVNANELLLESRSHEGSQAVYQGVIRIHYVLDDVEEAPLHVQFVAGHDLIQSQVQEVHARYVAVGELPASPQPGAEPIEPLDEDAAALPGPDLSILLLAGVGLLGLLRRRNK